MPSTRSGRMAERKRRRILPPVAEAISTPACPPRRGCLEPNMRHRRDNMRHVLARTALEGDLHAIPTVGLQRSSDLDKRDLMRPHLSGLAALLPRQGWR
jgi:hypothetical protein